MDDDEVTRRLAYLRLKARQDKREKLQWLSKCLRAVLEWFIALSTLGLLVWDLFKRLMQVVSLRS